MSNILKCEECGHLPEIQLTPELRVIQCVYCKKWMQNPLFTGLVANMLATPQAAMPSILSDATVLPVAVLGLASLGLLDPIPPRVAALFPIGIVDEECPIAKTSKVFEDWNAMLNQTNIGANNNKFYVIQLLETTVSNKGCAPPST